jgi:hypothetical protein
MNSYSIRIVIPFHGSNPQTKRGLTNLYYKKKGLTGQQLITPPNSVNGEPQNK